MSNKKFNLIKSKFFYKLTSLMATLFMILQLIEFMENKFFINDSVFGSNFYFIAGLHGFHVLIAFLYVRLITNSLIKNLFSKKEKSQSFFCNTYFHFVDIIWVIVFLILYCWSLS